MAALTLHTGLPGGGKTLNAIKEIFEDTQFQNRPVFYYGLKECTAPGWTELTLDQLLNWWTSVPEAAVILVDECQDVWRARAQGSHVPESVQQMEKTRHRGISFILTCQFPTQLDTGVRGLCGLHRHYERIFNSSFVKVYEYGKCKTAPDSRSEKREAVIKNIKLDHKYFQYYKSANIHLEKSRVPLFFWIVIILLVVVIPLVLISKHLITRSFTPPKLTAPSSIQSAPQPINVQVSLPVNYADQFKARLVGHPYSAPFYDHVVTATQYPKVSGCMQFTECVCNTQQGTVISDMPQAVCRRYVAEGVFDFDPAQDDEGHEFLPNGQPCCASGTKSSG
jgi:zona occludens toxin